MTLQNSPRLAYWGAWGLAALYNLLRDVLGGALHYKVVFNLAHFAVWGLLGLLALPLMRRYPLRIHWRSWTFHLLLGALLAQIDITLGHLIVALVYAKGALPSLPDLALLAFKNCFHLALLTYLGFLAVVQGLDMLKLARRRELQVEQHKSALVEAQLQSLKNQLQPHFLFNTLHAISALMHYDVASADRMLNRLSDLLRCALRDGGASVVSLRQEIAFTEAYLEIEQIRFEQRLAVSWAVTDGLHERLIPPFILQPLVENAIKHGVAPRAAGGSIVIRAYREHDALLLEVEDDAPEGGPSQQGFGIGLANTRARLQALYGAAHRLELLRAGIGTIARIRIPLAA